MTPSAADSRSWPQRWSALHAAMRRVHSEAEREALVHGLVDGLDMPLSLGFVNAHALNLAAVQPAFAEALTALDLPLRDGSGASLWCRRAGTEPGLNLNGTDLIPMLLSAARGRRVALWGTQSPWLEAAAAAAQARHGVQVVSAENGFHPPERYVELLHATQPEMVVLGMGMPKQELLAPLLKAQATHPVLIVCGGAILDFLGQRVSRAPKVLRNHGLEWLYRLLIEPRRMFSRYVIGIPVFFWRLARWRA